MSVRGEASHHKDIEMNYPEALEYLDSFVDYEKQVTYDYNSFRLERIRRLLELLGNPQSKIKTIQIAGTKGKGSTCVFVSSILREAGFKVGLYTSPHLVNLRERIRILNSESKTVAEEIISREEICALVGKMEPQIERVHNELGELTFFEVITALAFLYFNIKSVDLMVLEVGFGGRLDATNVVEALVCGITPISQEHTDKLGNTLRDIAREKSGIIKDNISLSPLHTQIVVTAPQKKDALEIIRETCKKKKARLYEVNRNIFFEKVDFGQERQVFNVKGIWGEYPHLGIKLLGEHQLINAATAVGIVESLRFQDIFLPPYAIRRGLENVRWPGRLEIVKRNPLIVLDGAHNRESASVLKEAVKKLFSYEKLILVLGLSKDKDIAGIFQELKDVSDEVILTQAANPRAANSEVIKKYIDNKDAILTSTVGEALDKAQTRAKKEDLILVTGSLFVVGEARVCLLRES